jgi:glycosyltransferase involved in cell wall biosynthesis
MKLTLTHDFLQQYGGAERILKIFQEIFPRSEIYTLIHDKKKLKMFKNVKTSKAQFLPFSKTKHHFYLPLYPLIISSKKIEADLVLSSSYAWVKSLRTTGKHICYCHSTLRFAHHEKDSYLKKQNKLVQTLLGPLIYLIRKWDEKTSKNTDIFIANSQNTRKRIKQYYNKDAEVIYPPVDTKIFKPNKENKSNYYLIVARLVLPYKQVDLAVKAFNKLGLKLKVVGSGRDEKYLKKIAKSNVEFLGEISNDNKLAKLYQNCKALIFPSNDDLGMTPLEAQSCGKPVIAYGKGGALETVIPGKTGIFFKKQTPESLINAVKRFENMKFNQNDCRNNALRFDKEIFKKKIKKFVNEKVRAFQKG